MSFILRALWKIPEQTPYGRRSTVISEYKRGDASEYASQFSLPRH